MIVVLEVFWLAVGNLGRRLTEASNRHLDPLYARHIADDVRDTY